MLKKFFFSADSEVAVRHRATVCLPNWEIIEVKYLGF